MLCHISYIYDLAFLFLPSLDAKGRNVQSSQFLRFAAVPGFLLGTYGDCSQQKMRFCNLDTKEKQRQETFTRKSLFLFKYLLKCVFSVVWYVLETKSCLFYQPPWSTRDQPEIRLLAQTPQHCLAGGGKSFAATLPTAQPTCLQKEEA